jgi:hypothetical protein
MNISSPVRLRARWEQEMVWQLTQTSTLILPVDISDISNSIHNHTYHAIYPTWIKTIRNPSRQSHASCSSPPLFTPDADNLAVE